MNRTGLIVLVVAIVISIAVTVFSGGRFILIGLPLLFGLPLAGMFGRGRTRDEGRERNSSPRS